MLCTLVVSAVLPLRTFLEQRGRIADLEQEQAAARERVASLEHAKQQLQDPAFLAAEARRRLHMARPGEVSYVLVTPSPAPTPAAEAEAEAEAGPEAPWWTQVYADVQAADRSGEAAPAPTPAVPAPAPAAPAPAAPAPAAPAP
ncbi:MAG: FtsB family cell division protein [Actinomycetes bacterium]